MGSLAENPREVDPNFAVAEARVIPFSYAGCVDLSDGNHEVREKPPTSCLIFTITIANHHQALDKSNQPLVGHSSTIINHDINHH